MATRPPNHKCLICGEPLQYRAVDRENPRRLMRPTTYEQLPHKCSPEAVEAFKKKLENTCQTQQ